MFNNPQSKSSQSQKEHKCNECYRKIQPGEQYEYYAGRFDGFFKHKTCMDCLSLREEFFSDGYVFEALWEDMFNHIFDCREDISQTSISKLTPAARAKVCDRIEEFWEDEDADD